MVISDSTRDGGDAPLDRTRDALDRINAALRGLRYGTVTAVVQDGVVVQVERTEKFRVEKRRGTSEAATGPPNKPDAASTQWKR
jgi:hypothetical protein